MMLQIQHLIAQQDVEIAVREAINDAIAFLPDLVGAIIILIVGWIIGRVLGGVVERIAEAADVDRRIDGTALDRFLGRDRHAAANLLGNVTKWYVYLLTVLAAANVLAIETLSEWLNTAVSYLPAFIAGLLIIVVGFIIADFVADIVERTETVTDSAYTDVFADGMRVFLYFLVIVIGLDTMGVDVGILYIFANALAWGLAAAIALAVGISFGWGGKDYVANNIDRWTSRTRGMTSDGTTTTGSDVTGTRDTDTTTRTDRDTTDDTMSDDTTRDDTTRDDEP
jgi:small-conductance mechanosensitive channel